MVRYILKCKNGHFFLDASICTYCGEQHQDAVEYREGDCIKCGLLCPGYAYGCASPKPIEPNSLTFNVHLNPEEKIYSDSYH